MTSKSAKVPILSTAGAIPIKNDKGERKILQTLPGDGFHFHHYCINSQVLLVKKKKTSLSSLYDITISITISIIVSGVPLINFPSKMDELYGQILDLTVVFTVVLVLLV